MVTKTSELLKRMKKSYIIEKKRQIPADIIIPNLSGDLSRGSVRTTPGSDLKPTNKKYVDDEISGIAHTPEGTAVKSTGEEGAIKFLREDGDNSCSWQVPAGEGDVTAAVNLTTNTIVQGDDGAKGIKTSTATVAQVAANVSHVAGDGSDHADVATNTAANHAAITLAAAATTGGMSLAAQEISNRAASNAQTGYATAAQITAIEANTEKNTNVTTNLSLGAGNATTEVVACSDGTDCTLVEADTDNAGLLGAAKWDEIVANTTAKHTQNTDTALGSQSEDLNMNSHQVVGLDAPAAAGETIRQTAKITEAKMEAADDHVNNNTQAHTDYLLNSGSDTSSGTITAAGFTTTGVTLTGDHGTAATDQVVNVCYGTGAAPTANTTTIGTLFVKYTA